MVTDAHAEYVSLAFDELVRRGIIDRRVLAGTTRKEAFIREWLGWWIGAGSAPPPPVSTVAAWADVNPRTARAWLSRNHLGFRHRFEAFRDYLSETAFTSVLSDARATPPDDEVFSDRGEDREGLERFVAAFEAEDAGTPQNWPAIFDSFPAPLRDELIASQTDRRGDVAAATAELRRLGRHDYTEVERQNIRGL